ncbi:Hypothetical protein HVR_LOCUS1112 [uncultured virus]|nr:Hypothetical protein HVR_LOCUS1112 [uncultured virus]
MSNFPDKKFDINPSLIPQLIFDPNGNSLSNYNPDHFGNLVGPKHPGFNFHVNPQKIIPDFANPESFGLPQPLPPGAVPPGARFDPFI